MKKIAFIFSIAIFTLASCDSKQNPDAMPKEERLKIIHEIEDKAFGENAAFDATMALGLVKQYVAFADENPEDEKTANYLFKAGDISMGLGKSNEAISYFDRIIQNHKDFDKLPYCLFLKAFVQENQLNDLEKAEASYKDFIAQYPDHEMTESAKFSLKNLGKTPEELIETFETSDSTQTVN